MPHYSEEIKASAVKQMLSGESVLNLSAKLGIANQTLYTWRKRALLNGNTVSNQNKKADNWPAETKLNIVIETAGMNAQDLSEYCRTKGLYPEQITEWKQAALTGYQRQTEQDKTQAISRKADQKKIKSLESQLHRKDKALAETSALLVLSKKLQDLWKEDEED